MLDTGAWAQKADTPRAATFGQRSYREADTALLPGHCSYAEGNTSWVKGVCSLCVCRSGQSLHTGMAAMSIPTAAPDLKLEVNCDVYAGSIAPAARSHGCEHLAQRLPRRLLLSPWQWCKIPV